MSQVRKLIDGLVSHDGELNFDPSTDQGMLTTLRPSLYRRARKLSDGSQLIIYAAYNRSGLNSQGMDSVKKLKDPAFVNRSAIYLASKLKGLGLDAVVQAPSSEPLVGVLAKQLASILGLPVINPFQKTQKISRIWVGKRRQAAQQALSVTDQPRLNDHVLLVDDFVTTGATMRAAAEKLKALPDITQVTGVCLATA